MIYIAQFNPGEFNRIIELKDEFNEDGSWRDGLTPYAHLSKKDVYRGDIENIWYTTNNRYGLYVFYVDGVLCFLGHRRSFYIGCAFCSIVKGGVYFFNDYFLNTKNPAIYTTRPELGVYGLESVPHFMSTDDPVLDVDHYLQFVEK